MDTILGIVVFIIIFGTIISVLDTLRNSIGPLIGIVIFTIMIFNLSYESYKDGDSWAMVLFVVWVLFVLLLVFLKVCAKDDSHENHNVIKKNINDMSGIEFEEYCCDVLKYRGFKRIERTPDSGDNGVDIVAYKDDYRYAFQCKRYSGKVGNKAVQEVYSGKVYYKCAFAAVISNSTYTKAAIELAEKLDVELITL